MYMGGMFVPPRENTQPKKIKKNAKKFGHIKKKVYLCSVIKNNYKCEPDKTLKIYKLVYFTYS